AVELVGGLPFRRRPGLDRLLERAIDVVDLQVKRDGRTAQRLGAEDPAFRPLVREVEGVVADRQGGVPDLAIVVGHPELLLGAQRLDVEVDGVGSTACAEVRDQLRHAPPSPSRPRRVTSALRAALDEMPSLANTWDRWV